MDSKCFWMNRGPGAGHRKSFWTSGKGTGVELSGVGEAERGAQLGCKAKQVVL